MNKKIIIFISISIILIICFIIYFKYSKYIYQNATNINASINTEVNSNVSTNMDVNSINSDNNSQAKSIMEFTLKDLNDKDVSISDYKGKRIFVNFWATWCPPCCEEIPYINEISQENQNDIKVITVNLGEEKNTVQEYINKNKYTITVLLDTKGEAANKYMIYSIPTSYLLDENGNIENKHTGTMNKQELKEFMKLK